jgi:signal transduction histidine kinase
MGKARVATDSTLTAFAQLSALRLDCQRSYISIMTSNHQYIIAEGTRTISVKSEDVYDGPDDAMYVGQVCVAFKDGLCPGTLATFTAKDNSMDVYDEWLKRSRSYYVMNDMSMLKDYKDRPYIAGWPYMKYYAEVPIHTPSGFTLGSLCVIDNRRKEGLDVKGLAILEEISDCIMDHLELSTCRIQRNNAERMIQALGQFVEGKPSVRQWWMEAQASRGVEPGLKHLSIEKRAEIELGTSRGGHPTTGNVVDLEKLLEPPKLSSEIEILDVFQENASHRRDSGFESTTSETLLLPDASVEGSIKGSSSATTAPSSNSAQGLTSSNDAFSGGDSVSDKKLAPHSQSQLEGMLSRATNLIREGIGLDGVSFFDPRSSDGLLLTEQTPVSQQGSWSDKRQGIRQTSTPLHPVHTAPSAIYQSQECLEKYSRIMASSTREHPYPDPLGPQTMHLPESTLGDIMKLFPRGGTLLYDEKGFISGSDSVFTWASTTSQFIDNSIKSTSTEHSVAANQLRQFLSGATSVLLFPLWDTERDKWFAYSMAWTTDSNRVIQLQDCAYLASFGNSIIAELSRFETIAADQAKGTFISSISHELRSPLHGIMASLELLRETNSDPISIDMINTVESCGSTLLETLDNLLTFAKINRASATEAAIAGTAQDHASLPRVDLGSLVEEITQMCMVGHNFRQTVEKSNIGAILDSPGAGRNPTVTVICDIAPGDEWVFNTGAGIWKRVLMNLLGNSLKYTTSGYIHVKLRREENISESSAIITDEAQKLQLVPSSRSSAVILSVEDSGRGISQDYLTHHLFKPFYQEDPMNPGNGLGLSIVSQLVSSINGFTNVTSELGVGTNVKVSAVLNQDLGGNDRVSSSKSSNFQNLRLGMFGLDAVPDLDETPSGILTPEARSILAIRSTLEGYAASLGISVSTMTTTALVTVDIVITTEAHFQSLRSSVGRPVIVLGGKPALHYSANRQTDGENSHVVILPQP